MKSYQDKVKEVQELLRQKEVIERRLKEIFEPERVAELPLNFSINAEVFKLVQGAGERGMSAKEISRFMSKQNPTIDRKRVASALAYLKNGKKSITQKARGVYVSVENLGNPLIMSG